MQPITILISIEEKHKLFIAITSHIKTTICNLSFYMNTNCFNVLTNFHGQKQQIEIHKNQGVYKYKNMKVAPRLAVVWKGLQIFKFNICTTCFDWKHAHCKRVFNLGWSHLKSLVCLIHLVQSNILHKPCNFSYTNTLKAQTLINLTYCQSTWAFTNQ